MKTQNNPNAFLFKMFVDGKYRICLCTRTNDKWDENEIVYIDDESLDFLKTDLHDALFNVIFVNATGNPDEGYNINFDNSQFMKSENHIAQEMFIKKNFFSTIEKGYQKFYEQSDESSREGLETETSE